MSTLRMVSCYGDAFDGQFALRLKESARRFDLPCDLFQREKGPGDGDRARVRSRTLLRSLALHPGEDVVYVDPDAQLHRRPDIFLEEQDYDVGVYFAAETLEISGPIFFRNVERTLSVVRDWCALNAAFPENSELENLAAVLAQTQRSIVVRRLPVTYAWVERFHRGAHPQARPVIVHFKTDGITGRIRIPR